MQRLTANRHATIDIVIRSQDLALRPELRPEDVLCRLKRAGAPAWRDRELTPASWRDCGHGVYQLTLAPDDFADTEQLGILVQGGSGLRPAIVPELLTLDVVDPPPKGLARTPCTVLCGEVVTADVRGKPKAVITARLAQLPQVIGGGVICNDQLSVEANEDGYFELPLATGANMVITIPSANFTRQIVVPPPQAPGIPVCLFKI